LLITYEVTGGYRSVLEAPYIPLSLTNEYFPYIVDVQKETSVIL